MLLAAFKFTLLLTFYMSFDFSINWYLVLFFTNSFSSAIYSTFENLNLNLYLTQINIFIFYFEILSFLNSSSKLSGQLKPLFTFCFVYFGFSFIYFFVHFFWLWCLTIVLILRLLIVNPTLIVIRISVTTFWL